MLPELDFIVITRDFPERGIVAGDIGTVMHVYSSRDAVEVEVVDERGAQWRMIQLRCRMCVRSRDTKYSTCARWMVLRFNREFRANHYYDTSRAASDRRYARGGHLHARLRVDSDRR